MANNSPSPEMVLRYLGDQQKSESSHVSQISNSLDVFRYGAFVGANIQTHASLPRAMEHGRELIRILLPVIVLSKVVPLFSQTQ